MVNALTDRGITVNTSASVASVRALYEAHVDVIADEASGYAPPTSFDDQPTTFEVSDTTVPTSIIITSSALNSAINSVVTSVPQQLVVSSASGAISKYPLPTIADTPASTSAMPIYSTGYALTSRTIDSSFPWLQTMVSGPTMTPAVTVTRQPTSLPGIRPFLPNSLTSADTGSNSGSIDNYESLGNRRAPMMNTIPETMEDIADEIARLEARERMLELRVRVAQLESACANPRSNTSAIPIKRRIKASDVDALVSTFGGNDNYMVTAWLADFENVVASLKIITP